MTDRLTEKLTVDKTTKFRDRIFEISFNVQDHIPDFKDRIFWGELSIKGVKELWKESGCTEEDCERIINEWEQSNKWWGDGHIYFNYLFVRPKKEELTCS